MTDKLVGARPSDQALAVPVEPASRLDHSGFDPSRWAKRVRPKRDWVRESVTLDSARLAAERYGASENWGAPISCFCWSKETWRGEWDCNSETKAIAVLFASGRVMIVRYSKSGTKIISYSTAIAMEARQRRDAVERPDPKDDSAGPQDIAQGIDP